MKDEREKLLDDDAFNALVHELVNSPDRKWLETVCEELKQGKTDFAEQRLRACAKKPEAANHAQWVKEQVCDPLNRNAAKKGDKQKNEQSAI